MVGKLSSRALVGGNSIIPLHDGDGAYPHMLDAIDKASKSILLCSYIFRDDKVGGLFADKLVAAHKRGVQVRVLVDGIGSGYFLSPFTIGYGGQGCRARALCILCCRGGCLSSICAITVKFWW